MNNNPIIVYMAQIEKQVGELGQTLAMQELMLSTITKLLIEKNVMTEEEIKTKINARLTELNKLAEEERAKLQIIKPQ